MHAETSSAVSERQILAVAGSGRSGTSLFAGLTARLGFHIPLPEVAANRTNPRGFGEPRWAVDFHNELLKSVGVQVTDGRPEAWDLCARVAERPRARRRLVDWLEQHLAETPHIVIKDPRLAWFLDLYALARDDVGADLRLVTMLRDPAENMRSREIAYGDGVTHTTRMAGWLNMMLGIEQRTRGLPRVMVRYDELLADWRSTMERADAALGLGLLSQASPEQVSEADELVDPTLHRSRTDWDGLGLPEPLRDLATRSYHTLQELAAPPAGQGDLDSRLDDLHEEYVRYFTECAEVSRSRVAAARVDERRRTTQRLREETRQNGRADADEQAGITAALRHKVAGVLGRGGR